MAVGALGVLLALLLTHWGIHHASAHKAVPPYLVPHFTVLRTFASLEDANLRDPTTAIFDPVSSTWHVYCTHVQLPLIPGYSGTIWHWSLDAKTFNDTSVEWKNEGAVLNASNVSGTFDESGVFTPAVVQECSAIDSCVWHLFFGGVQNQSPAHNESVGHAWASSPWGPFQRSDNNPVFSPNDVTWCDGPAARVDEIKAILLKDVKYLAVKGVCNNGTALPILYTPKNQSSWYPEYVVAPAPVPTPLFSAFDTCGQKGYEEPTFFTAPDGLLHFTGHNHGSCGSLKKYEHYISQTHDLTDWIHVGPFGSANGSTFMEPVPVPLAGDGVFGGPVADIWIDFGELNGGERYHLVMSQVDWEWGPSTDREAGT